MSQSPLETAPAPLPASRAELQRLVGRGRQLQAEAMQEAFRRVFRFLIGGCSLRGLRLPAPLQGQRQSCC